MPEQFDSHNAMTAFDHDSTLVVALELSGKSWQVGAVVPGVARRPRRRLEPREYSGIAEGHRAMGSRGERRGAGSAAGRADL